MARDKKTIKFNPLDKISVAPAKAVVAKTTVKTSTKAKASIKPEAQTASKLTSKATASVGLKPNPKSKSAVKGGEPKQVNLAKSSQVDVPKADSTYQALDGVVGYSEGISLDWQEATLQFAPKTQSFGFFDQSGSFIGFTAKSLKDQIHGGSLLPKALFGLVLGGGLGFALSYVLAKSPERYIYFKLQNEAGPNLYLRMDNKSLGYIS